MANFTVNTSRGEERKFSPDARFRVDDKGCLIVDDGDARVTFSPSGWFSVEEPDSTRTPVGATIF